MNKIVPFQKDITFKTNIFEITSISLEHTLKVLNDNLISGELIVSGEYKVTPTSTNVDSFTFNLPFDIHMDDHYMLDKVSLDIDDFYYEVINDNILNVNISIKIDNLLEKETPKLEEVKINRSNELIEKIESEESMDRCVEVEEKVEEQKANEKNIDSLFEINESDEKYSTYKVYIVRDGDTIESIVNKYGVNSDVLEEYNDLKEIKIGDKIIISSK